MAIRGLGFAALFAGQLEAAARYADQPLALAELAGNAAYQVTGLSLRLYIAIAQGDYLQAANEAWQCHQLAVSIDPEFPNLPFSWADRANVARLQGDYAQAQTYLQQAAKIEHTLRRGHAEGEGARQGSHYAVLLASGYLAETHGELVAATEVSEEIWQQDRNQSHYSAAALVGLG